MSVVLAHLIGEPLSTALFFESKQVSDATVFLQFHSRPSLPLFFNEDLTPPMS